MVNSDSHSPGGRAGSLPTMIIERMGNRPLVRAEGRLGRVSLTSAVGTFCPMEVAPRQTPGFWCQ